MNYYQTVGGQDYAYEVHSRTIFKTRDEAYNSLFSDGLEGYREEDKNYWAKGDSFRYITELEVKE